MTATRAVALPDQLDRAALDACVGNNFFPGIEASINLQDKDIYARPFRLDHTNLGKVFPGCLTEIMAVPWQADFIECDDKVWWPSQRPDIAMTDANNIPGSQAEWADPIFMTDHQGMVEQGLQLGFVVAATSSAGQAVFVEQDRDPQFPRAPVVAIGGWRNAPTSVEGRERRCSASRRLRRDRVRRRACGAAAAPRARTKGLVGRHPLPSRASDAPPIGETVPPEHRAAAGAARCVGRLPRRSPRRGARHGGDLG